MIHKRLQARQGKRGNGKFAAGLALLTLFALTGCEQDNTDPFEDAAGDKMQHIKIQRLKLDPSMIARKDVATGKPVAIVVQADNPAALSGVVPGGSGAFRGTDYTYGHADSLGRPRGADSDYVDKADVYWKLNWLRKHLGDARLPDDFEKAIKICREIMTTAQHDANYRLADDALTHLEAGLKHYRAAQILRASNTDTILVPWSGGIEAVQRSIDRGVLGFGEKIAAARSYSSDDSDASSARRESTPPAAPLTPAQQKIMDLVLDYARRYHASPEAMRRSEWGLAAPKINRLRDELGLMNRPENREDNYDSTASASGAAPSGTDRIVPIPPDPNSASRGMVDK